MDETKNEPKNKNEIDSLYIRPNEASKLLKVSTRTILNWCYEGKLKSIRTKGNHRRFLRSDIMERTKEEDKPPKRNICYCRISTPSQKEDLERQEEYFKIRFPNHEIVKDIGSGLNFKRKGFNSILDSAIKGDIGEIVVSHRDRLCRFGFDLVERIVKQYSNGTILVLDKEETSPEKELVNDLISIITVFSPRIPGLWSVKRKIKDLFKNPENKTVSDQGREGETNFTGRPV